MDPLRDLARVLPRDRILDRAMDRAAYSCDASFYMLTPRAVVRPASIEEVRGLFAWSRASRIPLTFRAAGTSLSGQAVTDGVIVDVSRHWRTLEVLDGGARVRVGPGVVGGRVNARLARHGTKLGPDPASIGACMIGGIVANNSSGMCCGIERNAYRTLASLRFVLASGTEIDSAAPGAEEALSRSEPEITRGLMRLKARIEASPGLVERIRRKHAMKNTMGYGLNAFLDFDAPLPILWHLIVGSEGTLAFIAEAVFRTVPDLPCKSAGLLVFPSVPAACEAIEPLRASGAAALELMDRASLRSIEAHPGVPEFVAGLAGTAAAILVEYQAATPEALAEQEAAYGRLAPGLPLVETAPLTRDPEAQARLWAARKGLTATIGAMRPLGTSIIFEDVAFPLDRLAAGVTDLQRLFQVHGYPDGIIFGHAKDGNVHFLLSQSFNDAASIAQYERFTEALVAMVVDRHGGALKAEHGTGRNMAPFVEREWGSEAYALMREVKRLLDPEGILNPGVLLSDDPRAHLTSLKPLPRVEDEVDRCIECGFCESRCPSRDLTVTPRQRIVLRRELARRAAAGDARGVRELRAGLDYALLDTCATDGMCATACPVGIDTGRLVKRLRAEKHGRVASAVAVACASAFGAIERVARLSLRRAGPPPRSEPRERAAAVCFASCVTRVIGGPAASIAVVAERAGLPVRIPSDLAGTCCGLPFWSKGFEEARRVAANRAIERAWRWTEQGRLPLVVDSSPCARAFATCRETLDDVNRERHDRMKIVDAVLWAHDAVLPRLPTLRRVPRVGVHPVCSVVHLGLTAQLASIARAAADEVFVPLDAGCCGFAGDRGLTHPELTRSATAAEASEIAAAPRCDRYVSSSRTCEIAMTRATGREFTSIWSLLEDASATL